MSLIFDVGGDCHQRPVKFPLVGVEWNDSKDVLIQSADFVSVPHDGCEDRDELVGFAGKVGELLWPIEALLGLRPTPRKEEGR
ncbi:MAG: hypothetical protein R3F19_10680 [Verrucomicrobiales bacterium]